MRCKHWSVPTGSEGRVFAVFHDAGSIFLLWTVTIMQLPEVESKKREDRREKTYCGMTHWGHDSVSPGVQSAFDHPFFCPGHADDGRGAFRCDCIVELDDQLVCMYIYTWTEQTGQGNYLIIVFITYQPMLGIDENPVQEETYIN